MPTSATAIADRVRAGELDPVDVLDDAVRRLEERDPLVHAYLDVDVDFAREQADRIADIVARGDDPGRLAGVPISLKDNIAVAGRTLTAGSRILEGYRASYTSHVAERLMAEGAVLLGRTNLDEFCMGASTENSGFEPSRNPWDTERVPGGSSGGSAAAVAAGIVPVAIGSETGGSIRQPAALCGITGFKPSYGAVSRRGLVAFGSSLEQIGPLAAWTHDAALVHDVIVGHDPGDATSLQRGWPSALQALVDLDGMRIGIPEEFVDETVDAHVLGQVSAAQQTLEDAGAITKVVSHGRLPHLRFALMAYHLIAASEASSNLARYDGMRYGPREEGATFDEAVAETRGRRLGDEVRRRIALGAFALSAGHSAAWYRKALSIRRLIQREFEALFEDFDLVAGPTSPCGAFPLGERDDDPYAMYLCDLQTVPACLTGMPSISVPCGLARRGPYKGLPTGLCLTGPLGSDHRVLAVARAFEAARGAPERCELYGDSR